MLGFCLGGLLLLASWLVHAVLEPYLRAVAAGSIDPLVIRQFASTWAGSDAWLAALAVACLVQLAAGFLAKRYSRPGSWAAPVTLLISVLGYVVFAQFPATPSVLRLAGWAIGLPLSFVLGMWLAWRSRSTAPSQAFPATDEISRP